MYITISYIRDIPGLLGGLYWQDEKTGLTKRVLKKAYELTHLSPNGCRAYVGTAIIELCN